MELFRSKGYYDQKPSLGAVFIPLFDKDGLAITEIARLSKLTKQTASIYVHELETLRYIKRKRDLTDKRKTRIFLTSRGRKLKTVADTLVIQVNSEFRKRLSTLEFDQLLKILRKYV